MPVPRPSEKLPQVLRVPASRKGPVMGAAGVAAERLVAAADDGGAGGRLTLAVTRTVASAVSVVMVPLSSARRLAATEPFTCKVLVGVPVPTPTLPLARTGKLGVKLPAGMLPSLPVPGMRPTTN